MAATGHRRLVALVSQSEYLQKHIAGTVRREGFQVITAGTPGAVRTAADRLTALVVVPGELDREDQRVLARMGLRSTVLAAVYPESILDAGDVAAVVDAWLFIPANEILFSETVALARSGYSAIPGTLADLSALDTQRRAILAQLSDCERDLLRAAAFGRTNREIAERLGTSEHYATYLLRRLLRRLKLRNRTEAAVFAARNLGPDRGSEGVRGRLFNEPVRH